MNSRRKFLMQGTMATCAFTVLKPLQGFSTNNFSSKTNKLVIIHGNKQVDLDAFKDLNTPVLQLHPQNTNNALQENGLLPFDLEQKADIRIGIIHLNGNVPADNAVVLNKTAEFLQQKHNCHFIVCVAYNNSAMDDHRFDNEKALAASSANIDLIVCNKPSHAKFSTYIERNKDGHEVAINASLADNAGKIFFHFNWEMGKVNIG